ncbi:unnamed protein product [Cyprideis torosa]|uniref:Uncharacterized protein n=1 Tax=Cyprideis torosa TaxID=163714 RepID=A0A7R8W405_9CRUS|nr:unnamed protein product [Cyprideis torosa]CAG0883599.1 unnamed protein product [Cyprideis torosa]
MDPIRENVSSSFASSPSSRSPRIFYHHIRRDSDSGSLQEPPLRVQAPSASSDEERMLSASVPNSPLGRKGGQSPFSFEKDDIVASEKEMESEQAFMNYLMKFPGVVTSATLGDEAVAEESLESVLPLFKLDLTASEGHRKKAATGRMSTTEKPKIGLDHLDNLCRLMEQLTEMREQNQVLQR